MSKQVKREGQKVTLTIGLPGSGKTTWAKKQVEEAMNRGEIIVRINNDDMRDELRGSSIITPGDWTPKFEKKVKALRTERLTEALKRGYDVILDNTYLNSKTLNSMKLWIEQNFDHVKIEEKDFRDVPIDVCIERDKGREERGERFVGRGVIMKMAEEGNLIPEVLSYPVDWSLPWTIICDLDGTLALFGKRRNAYDCTHCDVTDEPNLPVLHLIRLHETNMVYSEIGTHPIVRKIHFFTGRTDNFKAPTTRFLENKCGLPIPSDFYELVMRQTGDNRGDEIVKKEMFDNHIRNKYNVLMVVDDRPKVVRMWHSLGLPVFNVGDGREF